jgi:hypothetical protein
VQAQVIIIDLKGKGQLANWILARQKMHTPVRADPYQLEFPTVSVGTMTRFEVDPQFFVVI